jgi:hypothetical protein
VVAALPGVSSGKALVRKALFSMARIDRIHIIGCARSGTTMLHLAMGCFSDVMLSGTETPVGYPWALERAGIAFRMAWRPGRKCYITKRNPGWFKPEQQDEFLAQTRLENVGLIHLVRDPRDVMLSRHAGSKSCISGEPFVSAERWYNSIKGADRIFASLADYSRKLTLRYEDLVTAPERAEQMIAAAFGLCRHPDALPINHVKDNFERLRIRYSPSAIMALNGLRNMDSNSIGRWRNSSKAESTEALEPHIRSRLEAFCAENGYQQTGVASTLN